MPAVTALEGESKIRSPRCSLAQETLSQNNQCLGLALCLFPVAAIINGHKLYLIVPAFLVKKTCASSSGRNPPSKEQLERNGGAYVSRPPNTQNTHICEYTHVHMFTQTHKARHVGANL